MQEKETETQYQTNYQTCISEPIQSDSVNDYFERQKTQHSNNSYKQHNPQHKLQEQINQKLCLMIQKGKLTIPESSKSLILQSKAKSKSQCSEVVMRQKIKMLSQKKSQTLEQLRQLQKDQLQIKKFSVSMKKSKLGLNKLSRSFFMREQKQKIKQILIENIQLQAQLNQKTNRAIYRYRQQIKAQIQEHIKNKQLFRHKHKEEAKHFLQSLKKRKQQRKGFLEKTNKEYQELKHKKYLFHVKKQEQQIKNKEKQSEQISKINEIRRKMKIKTLEDIQQHQNKYNQVLKQKNQLRISKSRLIKESIKNQNSARSKIQSTYFSHLVKTQIMKIKQDQEDKKRKSVQFKQKINNFKEHLDRDIRPKIKISEESTFITEKKVHSLHSLSVQQQRTKGKQYLKTAKKLKKFESCEQQQALKQFQPLKKTTYKNYLQQMRKLSQHQVTNKNNVKNFNKYLQNKGKITEFNSLNKAFMKAQQFTAKSKKSNDQKLIDTVQTKINLLKMIVL